jgi:hypothetical protein
MTFTTAPAARAIPASRLSRAAQPVAMKVSAVLAKVSAPFSAACRARPEATSAASSGSSLSASTTISALVFSTSRALRAASSPPPQITTRRPSILRNIGKVFMSLPLKRKKLPTHARHRSRRSSSFAHRPGVGQAAPLPPSGPKLPERGRVAQANPRRAPRRTHGLPGNRARHARR